MKLIVLCVDGFDPQYAHEKDYDRFRFSASLTIPRECYSETLDGAQPATGKVWPSIFSGRIYDQAVTVRKGARRWAHDLLMKAGITWDGKKKYSVNPWNRGIESVIDEKEDFTWNLPTISPEWIARFPDLPEIVDFSEREYEIFKCLARGMPHEFHELGIIYTRYLDLLGHLSSPHLDEVYSSVSALAWRVGEVQRAKGDHLMMISDHGCLNGAHTDDAYIGATFPFAAESILDIRRVIEEVLK